MSTDVLPITMHIDAAKSITNTPWYVIMDVEKIKQKLQATMEIYELTKATDIDNDFIEGILTNFVRGPFFSIASAEKAMPLVKHGCYMSDAAQIYEVPGWPNPEYEKAYRKAMKEHIDAAKRRIARMAQDFKAKGQQL